MDTNAICAGLNPISMTRGTNVEGIIACPSALVAMKHKLIVSALKTVIYLFPLGGGWWF